MKIPYKTLLSVPKSCIPLLKEQRTCYTDHAKQYGEELQRTVDGFFHLLPENTSNILDIGCGMSGIDVFLSGVYNHTPSITLLDKNGVSKKINAGFNQTAEQFANYHDFSLAKDLLIQNGVPEENIKTCDIQTDVFPETSFDIVISLLSWGFHYPISTYSPNINPGGVIICDVRKDTDGLVKLADYGKITVVYESKKYVRVVVQC